MRSWRDDVLVWNINNTRDCRSSEETRGGKVETVKSDRKHRERSLVFELCFE